MTLAIDIIASTTNKTAGRISDVLLGVELATGLCIGDSTKWADLPIGLGSGIIDFVHSPRYAENGTYGDIARAFLTHRMDKLAR